MYNYSNNGVTVSSIIDERRETTAGYPVKIRVTYNRARKYYSTGKTLSLEDWDSLSYTKSKKLIAIRVDIQNSFELIKKAIQQLLSEDNFSLETLNKKLKKGSSATTLKSLYTKKIEGLKAEGKISTSEWYYYSLRGVILFAGENVTFNQITIDWLKKYEAFLLENGKSYTTISMYMRALQVIVNEAKSLGIIKEINHPFGKGKYEIPQHAGRNIALKLEDLAKLVHYEFENPTLEYYRDLWFFSYLCNGANIIDLCKFKYANIRNGELSFYRQKTISRSKVKKEIVALITPEMQAIIDRWGNKDMKSDNFIFPILHGNETPVEEKKKIANITRAINQCMTKIGKKIGIGKISTYTARHSYATVLKRSGANIAYISESLGHTDLKTTENYLASFEREEREKNAKLLTNF